MDQTADDDVSIVTTVSDASHPDNKRYFFVRLLVTQLHCSIVEYDANETCHGTGICRAMELSDVGSGTIFRTFYTFLVDYRKCLLTDNSVTR